MQLPEAAAEAPTAAPDDKLEIMITQAGAYRRQRARARQQRAPHAARRDRAARRREARRAGVHPRRRGRHASSRRHGDGRRGSARLRQAQYRHRHAARSASAVRPATRRVHRLAPGVAIKAMPQAEPSAAATYRRLLRYLRPHVWIIVAALVPAAIYALLGTLVPLLMSQWIDALKDVVLQRRPSLADSAGDRRAVSDSQRHGFPHGVRVGVDGPIGDSRLAHRGVRALLGIAGALLRSGIFGRADLAAHLQHGAGGGGHFDGDRRRAPRHDRNPVPAGHDDQHESAVDVADRRGRPRDRVGGGRHEPRVAALQRAHSTLDGRRHEAHGAIAARSSRRQGVRRPRAGAPAVQGSQCAQLPLAHAPRRRSGAGRRPDAVRGRARRRRRDVFFLLRPR